MLHIIGSDAFISCALCLRFEFQISCLDACVSREQCINLALQLFVLCFDMDYNAPQLIFFALSIANRMLQCLVQLQSLGLREAALELLHFISHLFVAGRRLCHGTLCFLLILGHLIVQFGHHALKFVVLAPKSIHFAFVQINDLCMLLLGGQRIRE